MPILIYASIFFWKDRKQIYFGEHGDDILCATSVVIEDGKKTLIASGEIGKTPAIFLYTWSNDSKASNAFTSLICLKGFHKKGMIKHIFITYIAYT